MIDLKLLRADPALVRDSLARRGSRVDLDQIIDFDARHRSLLQDVEAARAEQNAAGKHIAEAKGADKAAAIAAMRELSDRLKDLEAELAEVRTALDLTLLGVPNLVHPESPRGSGDESNRLVRSVGEPAALPFPAKDHLDIGEALGIIDVERASKVSGSRFAFLLGAGALLEFALVRLAMDRLMAEGFVPVLPPVLVRSEAMYATGFFPTDEAQVYKCADDDLYLAGTAEVPIASMHQREILPAETLPRRYVGFSTCFRREAGTYGKDTRGIIRVHQFDKVEGFVYCKPEDAEAEHDRLLGWQREMLAHIELPYRVIDVAAGDLGSSAARKFDCEAWIPTQQTYRELTSTSNCTTFQARRLSVRYRDENGKPQTAATLNGTLATTRWLVAILENHQQSDGSVRVPEALAPYVGTDILKPKR